MNKKRENNLSGVWYISSESFKKRGWMYSPGVALCVVALAILIAPRLFIAFGAALLLIFGAIFCVVAWKFIQLKKKFDEVAQKVQASVVFHPRTPGQDSVEASLERHFAEQEEEEPQYLEVVEDIEDKAHKKIVYH
jgi:hypothetical protein